MERAHQLSADRSSYRFISHDVHLGCEYALSCATKRAGQLGLPRSILVGSLLRSKIHHVDVGSEAHIVSQVPALVIRIFVDDDVVPGPIPIPAKRKVGRCNTPIPSVKPESVGSAACKVPSMRRTEAAREVTMLPGMIEMVVRIVGAGIMPHPMIAGIDVGHVRMARLVAVIPRLHWRGGLRLLSGVVCLVRGRCLRRFIGRRSA